MVDLDVYELTGGNYTISVVQQVDSGWEEIGSASVTTTGMVMINFTPQQPNLAMIARSTGSGSSVKVRIADGKYTNERAYDYSYTLCSKPRDNYRYGHNGQEKDNEIAGIGNFNHALYWEQDTRTGRRWNLDPKPIIGISPYAIFENNPIWVKDYLGDRGAKEKPKIIGSTWAKIVKFDANDLVNKLVENNIYQRTALSESYILALASKEALSLTMYDKDGNKSSGGNTTIGFGHVVHEGAIGSTQYDSKALNKEEQFKKGITFDQAASILVDDLESRQKDLSRMLDNKNVKVTEAGLFAVFFDVYYNAGTTDMKIAINAYQNGGKEGLIKALNEDVSQASKTRTQFRVDLLKDETPLANSANTTEESKDNTQVNSSSGSDIVPIDSSLPGKKD